MSERILKLCNLSHTYADKFAKSKNVGSNGDLSALSSDLPTIPFYIMTSPMNDAETREYFKQSNYFGLDSKDVSFFVQGVLPCLSDENGNHGKIILETPSRVSMAPDGNGGIYAAMEKHGVVDDMKRRNIKYIHVFSIDNALVKPADPVFIGYCANKNADCGNKVLWKIDPNEKVGVMAEKDGKTCIVEYSDLDANLCNAVDKNGRLIFGAANICNHFFTLDFLTNTILPSIGTLYHIARKKISYWDKKRGKTITPTEKSNGFKLESFIFDVFPLSQRMALLDICRDEEFAPVKNAPELGKTDTPEIARNMISDLAKKWARDAGVQLVNDNKDCGSICEISPLVSYAGEGLKGHPGGHKLHCPFTLKGLYEK